MFLSKSWPNKALLWKDWRLSMPIFLVWASFVTSVSTLTFAYHLVNYRMWFGDYWQSFNEFHRLLESEAGWTGAAMVLLTIALGAVSLGQERERGTLSLLASMPYARSDILLSKILVGLAQLSLPFIANALLMTVILGINRGLNLPFGAAAVWGWVAHSVLVLSFVLCVTVLAATVSGKTLGAAFLALVILLFPFGINVLIRLNSVVWEETGLVPHLEPLYWYWQDLVNDTATYLTVPTWLIDFPAVIAADSIAYVNMIFVERVFANRVWAFLRGHTYVLYLALVGLSFGIYAWARKWFAASQPEHDGELLAAPHLRSFIRIGFTTCSALLGGAALPGLFDTDGSWQLAMILLSYAGSATLAWMLTCRFLGASPAPSSGAKRKRTVTPLLLVVVVLVGIPLVAMFGMPRQLSDTQVVPLLALAEAVMERRTASLVTSGAAPLAELSNELVRESPEFLSREQAAIAQLIRRREALSQQEETYIRSETQLEIIGTYVRGNTATIAVFEQSKLYYALMHPNQPEYMAWEAPREFVFVRHGERWELTVNTLLNGKGLPPNEPGGE